MPVEPFYRGGFAHPLVGNPLTLEWDGTNEQDICDYINDAITSFLVEHPFPLLDPWTAWTVTVASGIATFTGWRGHPFDSYTTVTAQVPGGGWLAMWEMSKGCVAVANAGMWKTTDPYGRPDDVSEVFAPGTVLPWES